MNILPALGLLIALQSPSAPETKVATDVKAAFETKVSARAQGHELRDVLTQIFRQGKLSYVIEPTLRQPLYLQLEDKPLSEALELVCALGKVEWVERNGVIYVRNIVTKSAPSLPKIAAEQKATAAPTASKPEGTPTAKAATRPQTVAPTATAVEPNQVAKALDKRVTTRLSKANLKEVFGELSRQASVPIEIDADVPSLRLDAFLINTSLRYALIRITKATGLQYRIGPSGITIGRSAS